MTLTTKSEITKVTYKEFANFKQWYFSVGRDFQRMGQAFLNQYFLEVVDPELFYCENVKQCENLILTSYVEEMEN